MSEHLTDSEYLNYRRRALGFSEINETRERYLAIAVFLVPAALIAVWLVLVPKSWPFVLMGLLGGFAGMRR